MFTLTFFLHPAQSTSAKQRRHVFWWLQTWCSASHGINTFLLRKWWCCKETVGCWHPEETQGTSQKKQWQWECRLNTRHGCTSGNTVGGFGARFAAPFCRKHQSCVHCQGLLKHTVFQQRLNGPFQPNCWEDHCEIFRISFLLILTQTTKPSCENWSLHRSTLHSLLLESTGTRFKPLQFLLIQSYSQARNIPVDYKKQKTKHWGKIKHLTLKLIYCHSTVLELATRKATRTL